MSFLGNIARAFGLGRTPSNHNVHTENRQQPPSQPWGQQGRVISVVTPQVYVQVPPGTQTVVYQLPPSQPGIYHRTVTYFQQPMPQFRYTPYHQPPRMPQSQPNAAASNYWGAGGVPARSQNAPPAYTEKAGGNSGVTVPKATPEQRHNLQKLDLDTNFLPSQPELYKGYSRARDKIYTRMNQIPVMNDSALKDTLIKAGKTQDEVSALTSRDLKAAAFNQLNQESAKLDTAYRMLYSSIRNQY